VQINRIHYSKFKFKIKYLFSGMPFGKALKGIPQKTGSVGGPSLSLKE
jgi:hypothetical protein